MKKLTATILLVGVFGGFAEAEQVKNPLMASDILSRGIMRSVHQANTSNLGPGCAEGVNVVFFDIATREIISSKHEI
jgi:hypothetical protein